MTVLTHTSVREKLQELEGLPETEDEARLRGQYRDAKAAMLALGKAVNGGNTNATALGLLAGLAVEHRYLQNELVQVLITVLGNLPEVEGEDARNSFGLRLCREIRTVFKDNLFWKDTA